MNFSTSIQELMTFVLGVLFPLFSACPLGHLLLPTKCWLPGRPAKTLVTTHVFSGGLEGKKPAQGQTLALHPWR